MTAAESIFSAKQIETLQYLESPTYRDVTECFFGGSAGGGKTFLGCMWQIERRRKYAGTRGMIGRSKLKNLKLTTLRTFMDCWKKFYEGRTPLTMNYNAQDNVIYFNNGSEIVLKDLFLYPSDPDFKSLGSLELTDVFYDEMPEITEKAYVIANSRIRYKCIDGVPKSLAAGNPSNNWVKTTFVMDNENNPIELPIYRKAVFANVDDNPDENFRRIYKMQLEKLPYYDRMRLLHGDWTIIDNDSPFFYEFDYNANTVSDLMISPDYPLTLSFDFNINPCTALLSQKIPMEGIRYIKEFSGKKGTRSVLAKMGWLKDINIPLRITGDNSGHSGNSSSELTDYDIIQDYFRQRVEDRTARANGSHIHSGKICNHLLYNVPCYFSRKGCPKLINQMIGAKKKEDGKLLKVDGVNGNHLVDCYRYTNNLWFESVKDINHFADMIKMAA